MRGFHSGAEPRSMEARGDPRRPWQILFRALIGLGLIGFLVWRADLAAVFDALRRANIGFAVLAFGLVVAALVLGAFRWIPYLRGLGFEVPVGEAVRLSLIGGFFNAFLPTGIGGDAYKALRLTRGRRTLTDAFASVVLDRSAGVVGMAALAVVAATWGVAEDGWGLVTGSALALGILVVLAYGVLWMVGGRRPRGVSDPEVRTVRGSLAQLPRAVARGTRGRLVSTRAIAMGVVTGAALAGSNVLLARALHLPVPVWAIGAMLLPVSLVALVPLSINGVGFRETAYVWALGALGVAHDPALAFALLVLGVGLASSIVGGAVYAVAGGRRIKAPVGSFDGDPTPGDTASG
jgi:uncharacterized membrane protein YbhN (UPF0104 family)